VYDIPETIYGFVEFPESSGPMGAKAVGEPPINVAPAAVANAVSDAIGASVRNLPITPERVLALLENQDKED
jgi:CO/xanthine dehydrogenase Mo-binding subunit